MTKSTFLDNIFLLQDTPCVVDTTDGGKPSERNEKPKLNQTEQSGETVENQNNEDKVIVATDEVNVTLNGKQPSETGANTEHQNSENIQNDTSVAPPPVAPPRRKKKKNKGRPQPVLV